MSQPYELVVVDGRQYLARGWMNGITAPVGTILGPNNIGENLTVVESEPNRVRLAHTRPDDFTRMTSEPRSVREHVLIVDSRFSVRRRG